jgi:ferric-dicitrate binding protein FerR (iron transport regulator)
MNLKQYIGKSLEELLDDLEFISLIKSIDDETWEQRVSDLNDSSLTENMRQARRIILAYTNEMEKEVLSTETKDQLWRRISEGRVDLNRGDFASRAKRFSYLKIAATILIILSVGVYFLWEQTNEDDYLFSQSYPKDQVPVLLLTDGSRIQLDKNNSELVVIDEMDAIQINKDSIVKGISSSKGELERNRLNEVKVPYGTKTKLELSDGTIVWLNAGSRLAFPSEFKGSNRTVHLEGEGYFEVAHDRDAPFFVKTKKMKVSVLGTKFNVSAYPSDKVVETVLIEGSVSLKTHDGLLSKNLVMKPSQKATFNLEHNEVEVAYESDIEKYISWKDGVFQFSNEDLSRVLRKVERYYNVDIKYDDRIIETALPVSGKLDIGYDVDTVMTILSHVARINYERSDNQIIITE